MSAPASILTRTAGKRHGPITRVFSPGDLGELLKPFVFLDYLEAPGGGGPNFGFHPHSGIATLTAQYAEKVKGTKAVLIDTRKTIPGLRALAKHAAQVGGARNHRLRLDDGVLIKDNHIAVCGGIAAAVARARAGTPTLTKIEVECDTIDQVREALAAGADCLLLDNMTLDQLREAVKLSAGRVPLEASGGVRLETIRGIAETGVDFVSVGRITQSAPAVDIGLDVAIGV